MESVMNKRTDVMSINNKILCAYVFQFGFLQLGNLFSRYNLVVLLFSAILFLIAFYINKFKIKKYVLNLFILISILFFMSGLININTLDVVINKYFEFLLKGFSAIYIGSLRFKSEDILNDLTKFAKINFFALIIVLLFSKVNYMRFGYGLLPSVLTFIYNFITIKNKRYKYFLYTLISMIVMIIYGSRGSIICLILFLVLYLMLNVKNKITLLSIIGITVYFILKFNIPENFLNYLYYNLNIKTYSLAKLDEMFRIGLLESNLGRETIYTTIISNIMEKPLLGWGIAYSEILVGGTAHNLLLQVLLENGFIGLIIWVQIWLYLIKQINLIKHKNEIIIIIILIACSIGRLLVSSDYWLRAEYWLFISLILNISFNVKEEKNESIIYRNK